jgi:hypothetical protein
MLVTSLRSVLEHWHLKEGHSVKRHILGRKALRLPAAGPEPSWYRAGTRIWNDELFYG